MPALTATYELSKPTVGGDSGAWGGYLNANFDAFDAWLTNTFDTPDIDPVTGNLGIIKDANLPATFATAKTFAGEATFQEGITFGSTVAPSGANDLSEHIALFSTTYGFCVTANRLNYNATAAAQHDFYCGTTRVASILNGGGGEVLDVEGHIDLGAGRAIWFNTVDDRAVHNGSNLIFVKGGSSVGRIDSGPSMPSSITLATRAMGDARWAAISKREYKDKIKNAERMSGILNLNTYEWEWGGTLEEDDFRRGKRSYGLMIDEVAEHFPLGVELDDAGNPDRLNVGALLGALIDEVQRLTARVAELEKKA